MSVHPMAPHAVSSSTSLEHVEKKIIKKTKRMPNDFVGKLTCAALKVYSPVAYELRNL